MKHDFSFSSLRLETIAIEHGRRASGYLFWSENKGLTRAQVTSLPLKDFAASTTAATVPGIVAICRTLKQLNGISWFVSKSDDLSLNESAPQSASDSSLNSATRNYLCN
jgi:hypothetical protein